MIRSDARDKTTSIFKITNFKKISENVLQDSIVFRKNFTLKSTVCCVKTWALHYFQCRQVLVSFIDTFFPHIDSNVYQHTSIAYDEKDSI